MVRLAVAVRPPAEVRAATGTFERPGAVTVPAGAPLVLVEGWVSVAGPSPRCSTPLIWVETDPAVEVVVLSP